MAMKVKSANKAHCTHLGLEGYRAGRGLSLDAIAERTKISLRFLRAIEDEEFDKLPGGIFTTSYLRQYAAAVWFRFGQVIGLLYPRGGTPAQSGDGSGNPTARPAAVVPCCRCRWPLITDPLELSLYTPTVSVPTPARNPAFPLNKTAGSPITEVRRLKTSQLMRVHDSNLNAVTIGTRQTGSTQASIPIAKKLLQQAEPAARIACRCPIWAAWSEV